MGSIPGPGRSPGGVHSNPLQCSCLENPMDRGAWWATVHMFHKVRHSWSYLAHTRSLNISFPSETSYISPNQYFILQWTHKVYGYRDQCFACKRNSVQIFYFGGMWYINFESELYNQTTVIYRKHYLKFLPPKRWEFLRYVYFKIERR